MRMTARFVAAAVSVHLISSAAIAQDSAPPHKATPFLPIPDEAAPKLFVDQPLPVPLADRGVAIIPYRTENFRILPVFGKGATDVSPRAGHLHVSVDDLPWRWADVGNNDAVVIVGLAPGPHKVLIELATPVHEVVAGQSVSFTVPSIVRPSH